MAMTGDDFYKSIELSESEIEAALLEARKRKYFKEKHADYWRQMEGVLPKEQREDSPSKKGISSKK